MSKIFKTVSEASGQVSRAVFVKAARRQGLSQKSYVIAEEVFLKGYRQATVARHVDVPRQRVHSVCRQLLDEINKQYVIEREPDEKVGTIVSCSNHVGGVRHSAAAQHEE